MSEKKSLIRNAFIFQLKLGLDAIRDVLLSPIALIALLLDLLSDNVTSESYFYRLMRWGRFSDRWIGLFEISEEIELDDRDIEQHNVDKLIAQIEASFKEKSLTSENKTKLQHYLSSLVKNSTTKDSSDKNNPAS